MAAALATLTLKGLLQNGNEGAVNDLVKAEVARVKASRLKKIQSKALLVFTASGDAAVSRRLEQLGGSRRTCGQ